MTATAAPPEAPALGPRPGFRDVLVAEWTKLRSVQSTWWTLFAVFAVVVGLGCLICAVTAARWDRMSLAQRLSIDPTMRSLNGLVLAQLLIGVLGALVITSEYATGMIRSTLAAVPRRRQVLFAKVLTLVVPVFVVGTLAAFVAFTAGQAILASKGIGVSLGAPNVWRAIVGAGIVLTLEAVLALGIGALVRHTAGAIASYVGILLVVPLLLSALPDPWGRDITEYFPFTAGQALRSVVSRPDLLPPWSGFAVLCGWAVVAVGLAAWSITRRDA